MTDFTDFPVCPWCGDEDQDWWDGRGDTRDGSTWACVDITFRTEKAEGASDA